MAGTKEIKRRIKSVKNTKKITKAMELVAASKMKRAVASALRSRFYAEYSWNVLTSLALNKELISHPFFVEREVKKILLLLITSNRGLCGAYNAQVIKKAISVFKDISQNNQDIKIDVISVGKKGDLAIRRLGENVIASFLEIPDNIALTDISAISDLIINEFSLNNYDKVLVSYTDFVSALSQKSNIKQVLPVSKDTLRELRDNFPNTSDSSTKSDTKIEYLFEGDKNIFINTLANKLTKMQIYQMLLESNASEQSSRMIAMKNASEASGEMIDDLTLVFNKARQANITREISEISAGMASVS